MHFWVLAFSLHGASNPNQDLNYIFLFSFSCNFELLICGAANIQRCNMLIHKIQYPWQGWNMISYRGLLCNQKCGEDGVGYETTSGRQGASVLLISCLSVLSAHKRDYFIRVQASIASATAVFFTLCPPLYIYLSISISSSLFLSAPSARTSNSMVKYPGQCVALQRDSGSRYAGNRPRSKWRVIVERCGCTSRGPQ